ncbi:hypothetical protein SSS_05498 [Sarcoptes scabiei]|uniref:Transmembrane protein 5 n=2 Tax=Sarcoptes scabiei TaxID=52283 RepID=A0A834VHM0_SARSC|nr:hypothetical protein SSS_05498 [Sarcoptes scabiei]
MKKIFLQMLITQLWALVSNALEIIFLFYISCHLYDRIRFGFDSFRQENVEEFSNYQIPQDSNSTKNISVEIWSKSAIGQYVWENILEGRSKSAIFPNDLYLEGTKYLNSLSLLFRSGPSLKIESLERFPVENLILILNWRSSSKIEYSLKWLDVIDRDRLSTIKNIGIIALGNERCNNSWFLENYIQKRRLKNFRFLFIVYDWIQIDNKKIYQWPLGLATYRNFPSILNVYSSIDLQSKRLFLCNFIATIYPKSSREELRDLFRKNSLLKQKCLLRTRNEWQSIESNQSISLYVDALQQSDLTLSPKGLNVECYRILEAVEYGSIPVIEDIVDGFRHQNHLCDPKNQLRLFKETNAPFIYIRNWTEQLPKILEDYDRKSLNERIRLRIDLIKWYHRFKKLMKNRLIDVIRDHF